MTVTENISYANINFLLLECVLDETGTVLRLLIWENNAKSYRDRGKLTF